MMKRAVLMARVSSDEQAKGYSLDVQIDSLTNHCQRNDIAIVHSFKEDFSAKTFDEKRLLQVAQVLEKSAALKNDPWLGE